MAKRTPDDVHIGKFEILATFTYAEALREGLDDDQAKQRGMVAAIMGAQARLGVHKQDHDAYEGQKAATEKKKKTTITAESFDRQVSGKLGAFFRDGFLPAMQALVAAGLSYDEVKKLVKIPATWGAKVTATQFRARTAAYLGE